MIEDVYLRNDPRHQQIPKAYAELKGSRLAPELRGYVLFIDVPDGTEVVVEVVGLPPYRPGGGKREPIGPHGFHIHEYGNCSGGEEEEPFPKTGKHWNPSNDPHGHHAGDFPVLFSNNGYAKMSFFTNRFKVNEIVGKSIVIHENPDDFRTQPDGKSGKKIGCGEIQLYQYI